MRLGVPAFYVTMLNDIDMHSVKSTVTAAGLTLYLASHLGCQGVHRQLHGTSQGTVEGPLNWHPVADIAISVARAASTNPATMPTGGGAPVEVPVAVYVDDSSLAQSGPQAAPSLRKMVNMTGFMYYFLGLERRAKMCLWIRLVWCLGVLTRMKERAAEVLSCGAWSVDWVGCTASSSRRRNDLRRLHAGGWHHRPHRSGDSATAAPATGAQRDVGVRTVQD